MNSIKYRPRTLTTSTYYKLPTEVIDQITGALDRDSWRQLILVDKLFFRLAAKRLWFEVRGIDKLLKLVHCPKKMPAKTTPRNPDCIIGTSEIEYHIQRDIPEEYLARLNLYGAFVRILRVHDSLLGASFYGLSALLPLSPITPNLKRLVMWPQDHPSTPFCTQVTFMMNLCCPTSLLELSLVRTRSPLTPRYQYVGPRIIPSDGQNMLAHLGSMGVQLQRLNITLHCRSEARNESISNITIQPILGALRSVTLHQSSLEIIPVQVLSRLPHLAYLRLIQLDHFLRPLPTRLDGGHVFPSLEHIVLDRCWCQAVTKLLDILSAPLKVVALPLMRVDTNLESLFRSLVPYKLTLTHLQLGFYSPSCPIELSTASMSALSGLACLTHFKAWNVRIEDLDTALFMFEHWPQLDTLHIPELYLPPSGLATLAGICPRLTRLAVDLSNLLLLRLADDSQNELAFTSSLPDNAIYCVCGMLVSSDSPLQLEWHFNDNLPMEQIPTIAKFLVKCWSRISLVFPLDDDTEVHKAISQEILAHQRPENISLLNNS